MHYYDLICNEPILVDHICHVKIPTLRDIRKIGFQTYHSYMPYLVMDFSTLLEATGLSDHYNKSTIEEKSQFTFFNIVISCQDLLNAYSHILSLFILEHVSYHKKKAVFQIWSTADNTFLGEINDSNFLDVITCMAKVNFLQIEDTKIQYKSKRAEKIALKIAKEKAKLKAVNKNSKSLDLPSMISKYCADNKCGINILNVWDMTIYQFYDQFKQHSILRQIDLQDKIYANSASFKEIDKYDTGLWLKPTIND